MPGCVYVRYTLCTLTETLVIFIGEHSPVLHNQAVLAGS